MIAVHKFQFYCQKVLPLVYDESLSYYEVLNKLTFKVNEVVEQLNIVEDNVVALNEAVTQLEQRMTELEEAFEAFKVDMETRFAQLKQEIETEFAELKEQLEQEIDELRAALVQSIQELKAELTAQIEALQTELRAEMQAFQELTQAQLDEFDTRINEYIAQINLTIENFKSQINRRLNDMQDNIDNNLIVAKAYADTLAADLQAQIDAIGTETDVRVVDPADLVTKTVQSAFDNDFYLLRCWALRAGYYDSQQFTCEEYDNFGLTAYLYDYMAKWYMVEKPDLDTMYNPLSGAKENNERTVYDIYELLRSHIGLALTCGEYDSLAIMAEDYDTGAANVVETDVPITAYQFDIYSAYYLAGRTAVGEYKAGEGIAISPEGVISVDGEISGQITYDSDNESLEISFSA